jgi:hypothetical protein
MYHPQVEPFTFGFTLDSFGFSKAGTLVPPTQTSDTPRDLWTPDLASSSPTPGAARSLQTGLPAARTTSRGLAGWRLDGCWLAAAPGPLAVALRRVHMPAWRRPPCRHDRPH